MSGREGHHNWLIRVRNYLIGFAVTVLVLVLAAVAWLAWIVHEDDEKTEQLQAELAPFYQLPDDWRNSDLGAVLRRERIGGVPAQGIGWRILYRSEDANGSPVVSSGLVFAPSGPAPSGGRPVVAWAHGTVGMGDDCAPSRTSDPASSIPGLADFLTSGWVVAATDYAGLGTPRTSQYLVGGGRSA